MHRPSEDQWTYGCAGLAKLGARPGKTSWSRSRREALSSLLAGPVNSLLAREEPSQALSLVSAFASMGSQDG